LISARFLVHLKRDGVELTGRVLRPCARRFKEVKTMMIIIRAWSAAIVLLAAGLANTASAQMPPPPPPPPGVTGVNVGLLSCNLSPTIGLVVGSLQTMECRFAPAGPFPPEVYTGTFGTLGVDIGVTLAQGLAWQVYAPTAGPLNGALAGTYVGPSGEIGVGVGVGANILFGGSGRSYALQPVSLSGEVALNVSVGVSTVVLRWVP
jgi:hypothetical protein